MFRDKNFVTVYYFPTHTNTCTPQIGGRDGKYENAQYAVTEVCSCQVYNILS